MLYHEHICWANFCPPVVLPALVGSKTKAHAKALRTHGKNWKVNRRGRERQTWNSKTTLEMPKASISSYLSQT